MKQTVITYYLAMHSPDALRPRVAQEADFQIQQARISSPELSRFFYTAVGGNWYWIDRLGWTYAEWEAYIQRPTFETWFGTVQGTPIGYFELERRADQSVEIASFGLLPQFIGRGLGGALLTAAVRQAWRDETRRVWLHTCTLDGPVALQNYQARGFEIYKQESDDLDLPDTSPGPWIGAYRLSS